MKKQNKILIGVVILAVVIASGVMFTQGEFLLGSARNIFSQQTTFTYAGPQASMTSVVVVEKPILTTFERNIGVLISPYKGLSSIYNAFAVRIRKGSAPASNDGIPPMPVLFTSKASADQYYIYTAKSLSSGTYYINVGVGWYENGRWTKLENFSDTVSRIIP